jgi:hypothetical protein
MITPATASPSELPSLVGCGLMVLFVAVGVGD